MVSLPQLQLSTQAVDLLNNEDKSLLERFKLAVLLFVSPNVPVPKKEELVLEWVANTIRHADNSAIKKEGFVVISTCLSSTRLATASAELKPTFLHSLLSALGEVGSCEKEVRDGIRNCILISFKCPPLQNIFCRDIEILSLMTNLFCRTDYPISNNQFVDFCNCLVSISKLSLLQNELRSGFVESIFIDLCKLFSTILDPNCESRKNLVSTTDEILFRERSLTGRMIECFPSKSSARNTDALGKALVLLIRSLSRGSGNFSSSDEIPSHKASSIALCTLMQCVLIRNSENHEQAFKFFTLLCHAHGIKVHGRVSVEIKPARGDIVFSTLAALVSVMEQSRISLDLSLDETTTLSGWFGAVFTALVNVFYPNVTANLLQFWTAIFRFNPLIVEMCHQPLRKVMLAPKKEPDVCEAYSLFLSSMIEGAEKAGRFHKVLGKVCEGLLEEIHLHPNPTSVCVEEVIPPGVTDTFCTTVAAMPAAQVLNGVKSLHFNLLHCLNNVVTTCSPENVVGVELMSTLVCLFIQGNKIADYSVPIIVKDKFSAVLEKIEQCLVTYSEIVIQKTHDDRLLASFLSLCKAVGAYHLFSWKYDWDQDKPLTPEDNVDVNLTYVHSFLSMDEWLTIAKAVQKSNSKRLKHLHNDLLVQKMEAVAQLEEGLDGPGTQAARYLLTNASSEWLWENALLLLPKLEDNELLGLVESLMTSARNEYTRWLPVISSTEFLHNKRLIIAICIAIFIHLARHIDKNSKNGGISHKIMSRIAVVPLLEHELLRILHPRSEELSSSEVEIHVFLKEMGEELSKYLIKDPSPALPSEDFCIDGYIEILSKIPYEHCSYPIVTCAFLAILALLCDIPVGMNNDNLLVEKLNLILGRASSFWNPDSICFHGGAILRFLTKRSSGLPVQRELVSRFARLAISGPYVYSSQTCESMIRAVRSPNASTLWQTAAVIRAFVQAGAESSLEQVQSLIEQLGVVALRVLRDETPQVSLLSDYTIVLKHAYLARAAAADDEEDPLEPSPLPLLDTYCSLAMNNFDVGKPLIKLILKKWSFLGHFVCPEFLTNLWKETFIKCKSDIDTEILVLYFSLLNTNDLKDILNELNELLGKSIKTNGHIDEVNAARCFKLWEGLVNSTFSVPNARLRVAALSGLMPTVARLLSASDAPQHLVLSALSLLGEIAHQSTISLGSTVIDGLLAAVDNVVDQSEDILAVKGAMAILYALWRWRRTNMSDRLPALLQRFTSITNVVAALAHPLVSPDRLAGLESLAVQIFKVSQEMVRDDRELKRVAPFVVASLMKTLETHKIYSEVKAHFMNILYLFFENCDSRDLNFLSACLPASAKELYKTYYGHYKKNQYGGKI